MNTKKIFIIVLLAILAIVSLFLLRKQPASIVSKKVQVSASFYPLGFLASEIGGDKADVSIVTPAGAEPHDYELSPVDVAKITDSKILILNGRGLEAWGNSIKQNINPQKTIIVTTSEGLPLQYVTEKGFSMTDPHVWQDPLFAKKMATKIQEAFTKVDPANEETYAANLTALNIKLDALDRDFRNGLNRCLKKDIITSHSAFGYLAKEYGLNQISIAGLSPDAEPSPQQLSEIVIFARKNNVKYIFFESLVSPKLSQTVASEVGAQTLILNPIEGLTPAELSAGKNYLTEMRNNLKNLKIALQCE